MPLVNEFADLVEFICVGCKTRHSIRRIRRTRGPCAKCGGHEFEMKTEYLNGDARAGMSRNWIDRLVGGFMFYKLGLAPIPPRGSTVEITPNVSSGDAFHIAEKKAYDAKVGAFRLMNARKVAREQQARDLERQQLLARGGGECVVCGTYFVPSADKPWTKEKCCSKSCFAKFNAAVSVGMPVSLQISTGQDSAKSKAARVVAVACGCGNSFVVPALFVGAQRACPKCGQKVLVDE
jgi:Zn finger protein HypA/HybF involved in hydrogenase expression